MVAQLILDPSEIQIPSVAKKFGSAPLEAATELLMWHVVGCVKRPALLNPLNNTVEDRPRGHRRLCQFQGSAVLSSILAGGRLPL